MGVADKFSNKAEELGGRAKEAAGAASGDQDLKAEGQA
ncbi:MAG: CsbD family protein, partial [Actinomycetales bacterium]|nr:CsbD family protein [Actinomycetales bacterium]